MSWRMPAQSCAGERNTALFHTCIAQDWSCIVCAGMTSCPSCLAINTWNAPWPHSFRPLQHPNITTTTEPWIAPFNWCLSFFKVNILSVTGARPLSLEANKHTQSYSESSSVFILRLYYKTWCYYCIYLIACLVPLPWNLLNINPPIELSATVSQSGSQCWHQGPGDVAPGRGRPGHARLRRADAGGGGECFGLGASLQLTNMDRKGNTD